MRALPLASALLLALAACSVDTDSLKPKTDAECAATGTKACGYKCVPMSERCGRALSNADCAAADPGTKACGNACVSMNDPAVGCSTFGCTPCPLGPLGEAAVCAGGTCAYVPGGSGCPPPKTVCNGECVDPSTSSRDCGVCDHACAIGSTCSGGVCAPSIEVQAPAGSPPRDITCHEYSWLFFYDAGSTAWFNPDTTYPTDNYQVLQFSGPFGVSPRLTSTPWASSPYVYFAGRDAAGLGGAIWEYDSYFGTNDAIDATPVEGFSGLAISDAWVYWTQPDLTRSVMRWVERSPFAGPVRLVGSQDFTGGPGVGSLQGVATVYSPTTATWHVFGLAEFAIIHLEEVGGAPTYRNLWNLTSRADRIAATLNSGGGIRLYLADSISGQVWLYDEGGGPTLVDAAVTPGGRLDLVADAAGAYWTLGAEHRVMEYRAFDGAVFALADITTTTEPWGICLGPWSGYVAWSDTTWGVVRSVLK